MRGYLSFCCLPVSSNQSGHSPLTSLINKVFLHTEPPLTGCCFLQPFPVKCRNCCAWKSRESSGLLVSCLALTIIPWAKSLRSHIFPILMFVLNHNWTCWQCRQAFMQSCCHIGTCTDRTTWCTTTCPFDLHRFGLDKLPFFAWQFFFYFCLILCFSF